MPIKFDNLAQKSSSFACLTEGELAIIPKTAVDPRLMAQHLELSGYMKICLITNLVTTQIFITPSKSIYCTLNSRATAVFRITAVHAK